jgi:hypothetical protein
MINGAFLVFVGNNLAVALYFMMDVLMIGVIALVQARYLACIAIAGKEKLAMLASVAVI